MKDNQDEIKQTSEERAEELLLTEEKLEVFRLNNPNNEKIAWEWFGTRMKYAEELKNNKNSNPRIIHELVTDSIELITRIAICSNDKERIASALRYYELSYEILNKAFKADMEAYDNERKIGALVTGIKLFGAKIAPDYKLNNAAYKLIHKFTGNKIKASEKHFKNMEKGSMKHWLERYSEYTENFVFNHFNQLGDIFIENEFPDKAGGVEEEGVGFVVTRYDIVAYEALKQIKDTLKNIALDDKRASMAYDLEREPFSIFPNFDAEKEKQKKRIERLRNL